VHRCISWRNCASQSSLEKIAWEKIDSIVFEISEFPIPRVGQLRLHHIIHGLHQSFPLPSLHGRAGKSMLGGCPGLSQKSKLRSTKNIFHDPDWLHVKTIVLCASCAS
jgi:hypothetical protein